MIFSCPKERINEAVSTVSKAASVKATISALEGIKVEAQNGRIKLSAYDFNIAISSSFDAAISEEGVIVFPAKLFGDIIRKLPNEDIYIECDPDYKVRIACGGTNFEIMGVSPEEFPKIPEVSDENRVDLTIPAFKSLVKRTIYAASTSEFKPVLTGILFEINDSESYVSAIGVDQYRLAIKRESFEYKTGKLSKFIIPAKNLKEIFNILPEESNNNISISVSDKNVSFTFGNFVFVTRTLEGEFIKYNDVIPKEGKFRVILKTKELRSMIDRAAIVATSNAIKNPIRCDFEYDTVKISTASNIGKFSDRISTKNFQEKMTIGFNNRLMLEALQVCEDEEIAIRINSELTPIVLEPVEGESFLAMVLPMRLNLDLR